MKASYAAVLASLTVIAGALAVEGGASEPERTRRRAERGKGDEGPKGKAAAHYCFGNPKGRTGFTVWAVSPRAGLLFTDSEPVDVRVRVGGAEGVTRVAYAVRESEGPWRTSGQLALEKGTAEKRLPLDLPGRGLYQLDLSARSGKAASKAQTWVAVVFTPGKPDPRSPWGIFYTPHVWFNRDNPNGARDAALSHKLLGASWSRLNFWAHSFGKVTVTGEPKPAVTADYPLWKSMAKALREQGISILGEVAQCPRELSSRPNETAVVGDAGPVWCRVKPRDYALWEQLMERLAADFREEIGVWEIWNEPNLPNRYWTGSVEDFAELVKHTSQALRRGNPEARIAVGGFVDGHAFADRLFDLGIGEHIDILSVHYTDERPGAIARWQDLLKKHRLKIPIWNTEERSEVPLRNLASPIERSFKFIHVAIGYEGLRPLVRKDLTVLPAGIAFSVGAHCIGAAGYIGGSDRVPGWEVYFFRRGAEVIGVFRAGTRQPKLLARSLGNVVVSVEPLRAGKAPTVTDLWGRSSPLKIRDGRATVRLRGKTLFVNGARKLQVAGADVSVGTGDALVFEAEKGRCSAGWSRNRKAGFSEGSILEIWAESDPGALGYWAELELSVPAAGRYEILFSGNALSRLKRPRTLSPFIWSIDGGEEHQVDRPVPVIHDIPGAPEGLSVLGAVELKRGEHTFRLRLTGRRDEPDKRYALWFDAIALRRGEPRKMKSAIDRRGKRGGK